ncbi:MAG: putative family peptidase [Gemmatimonadetes bacterium]|nr:putative family peptidase [Gemmatimonadota bacterium]
MPTTNTLRAPLATLAALLLAGSGCAQQGTAGEAVSRADLQGELAPVASAAPARIAVQDTVAASRRTAIVTAAQRVAPAVVSVNVRRRERVQPSNPFEQMMLPPGYERESAGLGSGFVFSREGLVLTNEHVVRGATEVVVTLADGRELDAEVRGVDEVNDLAVLRLKLPAGSTVPVAPLGSSGGLMIGEWVVAIGNPFGFYLSNPEPSVTAGVVSAVGRNIIPSGGEQHSYYLDMIQTDASINPGNSGGPLVNALGEVVGVNSSILSSSGGSEGLGFAIPIDRARRVALDLAANGRVRRPWIGAQVEQVRTGAGEVRTREVRVSSVVPGSPAERGGLRAGMTVESIAGRRVRSPLDWDAGLLLSRPGERLQVRVAGDRALTVTAGDLPSVGAQRVQALRDFQLVTLTPAIRAERGLSSERGALIVSLSEPARRIGLQEGDLILQVNRVRVGGAEEAAQALQALSGRSVVVYFERGGQVGATEFVIGG